MEVPHKEIRKYVLTNFALKEDNENETDNIFNLKEVLLDACYIHNSNIHTTTKKRSIDLIKNTDKILL